MKATVLDGSRNGDPFGSAVSATLHRILDERGAHVKTYVLRNERIHKCAGDFYCWVRYPGQCMFDDANLQIAAAIEASDVVVYLTPITFGGYSSALKSMVDHEIQLLSPFFETIDGETHHKERYPHAPRLLAIGWDAADDDEAAVFRHLVRRNQINFHSPSAVAGVLPMDVTDDEMAAAVTGWLHEVERQDTHTEQPLPADIADGGHRARPRTSLLLVGSPRGRKSSSFHLGTHLQQRLAADGVATETKMITAALRNEERWSELIEAVDWADVVCLAYPLYVDSLPTPMIEALERIAAHRAGRIPSDQRLMAIANCGFPEADHNRGSLAMCRLFATEAGFRWSGGLSLGGGQGAVQGRPLVEGGASVRRAREALDMTAAALLEGDRVPVRAQELMAMPFIPPFVYRAVGTIGWHIQAHHWGVRDQIGATPYAG